MTDFEAFLSRLSREPDFDAPELRAYDSADLLLLETAAEAASEPAAARQAITSGSLVVIGDRHGALTLGAIEKLGARGVRVQQDPLLAERALASNAAALSLGGEYANHPLGDTLLTGAQLVLLQLPKSLAELEEIAWHIARWSDPRVVVLAGGRDKHMSRGMNEVLARYFGEVSAGLGRRKARVLTARAPRSSEEIGEPRFPTRSRDPELEFDLFALGATFGGAAFDHGSRLLLRTLSEDPPKRQPTRILDLGCGNGVLAVSAALAFPGAEVIASDQSAAAVEATGLTARAAGVGDRVTVQRADATEAVPEGWADLVLLNPPFHTGSTVHAGVAHRLISACAGVLAHGGELRLVFNSHLGYRGLVNQVIGQTRQLSRDKTFTVLSAIRRGPLK